MIENKKFSDKTILYLVHVYSNFQKDPIEEAAQYFKKVYVLVRYKPISRIAKHLPIKWLKKYDDSYVVDMKDVPSNVEVIRTPVWYLPFGIFYKWLGNLHLRAVERAINKHNIKFDIVHSHFIWSAGYVGMKLKEKYKVPFVVTGHGFDVYELPFESKYWMEIVKEILNNSDALLTVSEKNRKHLLELGIKESEISVLENGYSSKLFYSMDKGKVREELGINKNDKVLVTIGSLEKIKGHKFLINGVKLLVKNYPDIKCYIIGGGSLEKEITELIKGLHLEKHVFLLGHIPHSELNKWINVSDVFVMSSLNEGLPISMLEALGCGKPFVGTKVGGIPDIINSEKYGILVEAQSGKKLSSAIDIAFTKKWSQEDISNYGKNFTIHNLVIKTLKVYSKLFKN